MSNKVIKFPNTPANQLSETAKLAMEMETEKNMYQENIEWMMLKNDWDKLPDIDGRSLDMLALFGDVMVFTPETSQKIICKLAEQIKKNQLTDPLEEYLRWVEKKEIKLTQHTFTTRHSVQICQYIELTRLTGT